MPSMEEGNSMGKTFLGTIELMGFAFFFWKDFQFNHSFVSRKSKQMQLLSMLWIAVELRVRKGNQLGSISFDLF